MKTKLLILVTGIGFVACTRPIPGFSVADSQLRYETVQFSSSEILAKAGDIEIRTEEIAANPEVMADLEQKTADIRAALVYKKVLSEMRKGETGTLIIYYANREPDVKVGTMRIGVDLHPGIRVKTEKRQTSRVVGNYDDKDISASDIDFNHIALQEIEKQRFHEVGHLLNRKIVTLAVKREAKSAGMTDQDFVEQKIISGMPEPTLDEFRQYLSNIGEEYDSLSEDLRLRHRVAFEARLKERRIEEFVSKNILKSPIQVAFQPPAPDLNVDLSMEPILGLEESPVSLVVFANAACEDCLQTAKVVNSVMKEFAGDLRLNWIFHHASGEPTIDTDPLERAALCVEAFKPRQMLDFLTYVDSTDRETDNRVWDTWVNDREINHVAFQDCLLSDSTTKLLKQHHGFSASAGVLQNPSVWINGQLITGSIQHSLVSKIINDKLQERGEGWFARSWRHLKAWVLNKA